MFKSTLAKEILCALVLKLLLLYGLWALCFSHPTDNLLSALDVASHVFDSTPAGNHL